MRTYQSYRYKTEKMKNESKWADEAYNGSGYVSSLVSDTDLFKAWLTLRALNNKTCQRIIATLMSEGELSVTEIYIRLRVEQSVVSQYLRMVRGAGIVLHKRSGKNILYSLNYERLEKIHSVVTKFFNHD